MYSHQGKIVFDNNVQDDLIIIRSNGYPHTTFQWLSMMR